MQHYAVIHKYVGVHCCIDGVERYGQVKLLVLRLGPTDTAVCVGMSVGE